MADDVPDVQNLESWQDAFQYQIPTVRRVEQTLRRDIANSKDRLRSLVGVRYRDLLDTAQTIVGMNEQIQQVEADLADVGQRCNPRAMAKKSAHLHELDSQSMEKSTDDRVFAAHLTLLHNCTVAISRIVRSRASSVLAAKLLVVSRLLHKALTQNKKVPPFVDNLRRQLESLRQTLLQRIKRRLVSVDSTTQDMIEAMSAFCLATSSSFRDAIRHFHDIRLEAIESRLTRGRPTNSSIVDALNLYVRTLQRTAEVISGHLSDALGRLTAKPILNDPTIQDMGELGIDVLEVWISNDIKHFTPWIKHNNLTKQESDKVMKQWSRQAFDRLCMQAGNLLRSSNDFRDLVCLRENLLEAWLPIQYSTPTHSSLEVLQGIRDLINNRLLSILRAQSEGLTSLGLEISSTVTNWTEAEHGGPAPSPWDPGLAFMDFSEGAGTFKEDIINRMLGRSATVQVVLESYCTWISSIQGHQSMISELRHGKWDDLTEDDEDEDPESVVETLNEDDPHLLQEAHEVSLVKGFATLQTSLHGALANMDGAHRGSQAAFMLRIIREIRRRIPPEYSKEGRELLAEDMVPKLHHVLATETVCQLPLPILTRGLRLRQTNCGGHTLWEGDPPLPSQPSPMAFKFLRELTSALEHQGQDLWNLEAVNETKCQLVERLASNVRDTLAEIPATQNDGTAPAETNSTKQHEAEGDDDGEPPGSPGQAETPSAPESSVFRDHKIQLLFDLLYMSHALAVRERGQPDDRGLGPVVDILTEDLGSPDSVPQLLEIRAREYWTRTQLLFGLLA